MSRTGGINISGGVKGARLSVGTKGVKTTLSLPGTGYRKTKTLFSFKNLFKKKAKKNAEKSDRPWDAAKPSALKKAEKAFEAKDMDTCMTYLSELSEDGAWLKERHLLLAKVHLARHEYALGLDILKETTKSMKKMTPWLKEALYYRGLAEYELGLKEAAKASWLRVYMADPAYRDLATKMDLIK